MCYAEKDKGGKIMKFLKHVVVPVVSVLLLVAMFRPLCMEDGVCDYLKLWIIVGIPFGIHRMFFWVIPRGYDLGGTLGIWTLNFLVGGVIGGVVVIWRLAVAAFYLLKMAVTGTAWTVRKLSGAF